MNDELLNQLVGIIEKQEKLIEKLQNAYDVLFREMVLMVFELSGEQEGLWKRIRKKVIC